MINDVIGGDPVLITYCPLCVSGVVFSREVAGQTLTFGNTSALYQSDLVMYDHQTDTLWSQFLSQGVKGPLLNKKLEIVPAVQTTW